MNKHKVFISYYHKDDQYYKNVLLRLNGDGNLFLDYSVLENEIDDTGKTSETIRKIIRDEYTRGATVLVLLCGENTKRRKHIDWEIHAAMFDTELNPKMGILIINLPSIVQGRRASGEKEKQLVSSSGNWITLKTREEFHKIYPYMPERITDNFVKGVDISVVEWDRIHNNKDILIELIDIAYTRRKNNDYDYSTPLRRNNS